VKTLKNQQIMRTLKDKIDPQSVTPEFALQRLKEGNFRFLNNLNRNHDLLQMVNETKDGQWPFAAILSCMDSRTAAELVFDQGLGDVFSIRVAGNVVGVNILGSLEYATAFAGSKLIVVLGHTNCGAIKGACDHVVAGNLTSLLQKIQPAVESVQDIPGERNSNNRAFVEAVAVQNVKNCVQAILQDSEVIRSLVEKGTVGIVPAIYDVATGKVSFLDTDAVIKRPAMAAQLEAGTA
jgi:carbonic anhydrase